jgi:hypothetical protein
VYAISPVNLVSSTPPKVSSPLVSSSSDPVNWAKETPRMFSLMTPLDGKDDQPYKRKLMRRLFLLRHKVLHERGHFTNPRYRVLSEVLGSKPDDTVSTFETSGRPGDTNGLPGDPGSTHRDSVGELGTTGT